MKACEKSFEGRHYETGTISNWLRAEGKEVSEALVFGMSGGIAVGYFVFEYAGYLPHVALLTRNTFDPIGKALDNLAIRRTVKETVKSGKGVENLDQGLDEHEGVIVWGDSFLAPWNLKTGTPMWAMQPMLVVGRRDCEYAVVDSSKHCFPVGQETLLELRSKVKKDRFRLMTFDGLDQGKWRLGATNAIKWCLELYFEKPPAGSVKNFGLRGLGAMAEMVRNDSVALGWGKKFPPGDPFKQAILGRWAQPGIFDWIELWGTEPGADRRLYAEFLRGISPIMGCDYEPVCKGLEDSGLLWSKVADELLGDAIPKFQEVKMLKREAARLRFDDPIGSIDQRGAFKGRLEAIWQELDDLGTVSAGVRSRLADGLDEIRRVEGEAMMRLKGLFESV